MKNLILAGILLFSITTFSQGNSDGQGNSDLDNWLNGNSDNAGGNSNGNGNNPNSVPIDNAIVILAIIGVVFAYRTIYLKTNKI